MNIRSKRLFVFVAFAMLAVMLSGCSLFKSTPTRVLLSADKSYVLDPSQGLGEDTEFEWYNELYHDIDGTKLTDGKIGAGYMDGNYVGFRWTEKDSEGVYIERDVSITLDLEESYEVEFVRTHWTWDLTANIRYPDPLTIRVSEDGTNWSDPIVVSVPNPETGGGPKWVPVDVNETGRYVRIEWTIKDSWYHISEFEVYGPGK